LSKIAENCDHNIGPGKNLATLTPHPSRQLEDFVKFEVRVAAGDDGVSLLYPVRYPSTGSVVGLRKVSVDRDTGQPYEENLPTDKELQSLQAVEGKPEGPFKIDFKAREAVEFLRGAGGGAQFFSDYSFLVNHLLHRHLLAHAMASDFSVAHR
jgi:hypothetical protein